MSNSKYARDPLELHRENDELTSQLKEVIRMNTHWQRYDSQREDYVRKLTRTNQDLQDQVSKLQQQLHKLQSGVVDGQREHPSDLQNNKTYKTSSSGSGSHWNAEDIIRTLKDHITKLNIQIYKMENESETLQKQHEQNEEQISLLKEQVNICVDDFKQERTDRERCHEENIRLQKRLAQVEKDLRLKKEQLHIHHEEQECLRYRQDYERTLDEPFRYADQQERPRPQYRTQALPRRHIPRYHYRDQDFTDLPSDVEIDGASLLEGYDEIDGPSNKTHDKIASDFSRDEVDGPSACELDVSNRPSKYNADKDQNWSYDQISETTHGRRLSEEGKGSNSHLTSNELEGQETDEDQSNKSLICPKCMKRFGVMKHLELIEHITICVEND